MDVRIRFEKHGSMRYVGHLDMMRYFQKAVRRSGLPVRYSEGFNPHQVMSFAQPLGLGMTSGGEYVDISLTEDVLPEEGLAQLSAQMLPEVRILSFVPLCEGAKNAMASVAAASWMLVYANPESAPRTEQLQKALEEAVLSRRSVVVEKTTKKGARDIDIRPLIYEASIRDDGDQKWLETLFGEPAKEPGPVWRMMLSASSADSVKPVLVTDLVHRYLGLNPADLRMRIHRQDLLAEKEGKLVSLGELARAASES